ncbi:MAG: methionine adenosyltransferase domain-containing protein [bacterium]
MKKFIAESVTYLHPDKICDQISDAILDECLKQDSYSKVAIEVVGGHGLISLIGEITTQADVDLPNIALNYYKSITGKDIVVKSNISKQSREIAQGVDTGGAGDQGIMIGYACMENDAYIPNETYLARRLLKGINTDGKSQVVIDNGKIESVVLSVQGKTKEELQKHIKDIDAFKGFTKYFLNNTGSFEVGGFDADTGCTGRKIVVDAYGPRVPVGGGAFSGKDPSKVDRSAAYMARWIALKLLKKYGAKEVMVKIGYVIGGVQPLLKIAYVDGKETIFDFDCRPEAIIERFDLRKPIYTKTARQGHFGFIGDYPWESFN